RYTFLGFVPRKGRDRKELLQHASRSPWTVVMFEAANRLVALLEDLAAVAGGDRTAVVGRELTKLHEDIRSGSLAELAAHYRSVTPRGEVTLLLAGESSPTNEEDVPDLDAVRPAVATCVSAGECRREALRRLMDQFAVSRNDAPRMVMAASTA